MRLATVAMIVAGVAIAPVGSTGPGSDPGAVADHLTWSAYDDAAVRAAIEAGRPVILDFYADWCAPCRELDEKTFADARVAAALGEHDRFKVDLTRASAATAEISQAWGVRGVPTVVVLAGGQERFRITGFEPPEPFLERLR
jgi:thiol:disulfide interchange protein DsbD